MVSRVNKREVGELGKDNHFTCSPTRFPGQSITLQNQMVNPACAAETDEPHRPRSFEISRAESQPAGPLDGSSGRRCLSASFASAGRLALP